MSRRKESLPFFFSHRFVEKGGPTPFGTDLVGAVEPGGRVSLMLLGQRWRRSNVCVAAGWWMRDGHVGLGRDREAGSVNFRLSERGKFCSTRGGMGRRCWRDSFFFS